MSNSLALLKWPGGKRALLKDILPLVPDAFNRYYEPFVGGGALFFALQPSQAILADRNKELMICYEQVRDCPEAVIVSLSKETIPNRGLASQLRFGMNLLMKQALVELTYSHYFACKASSSAFSKSHRLSFSPS